jgi:hypothetical protein
MCDDLALKDKLLNALHLKNEEVLMDLLLEVCFELKDREWLEGFFMDVARADFCSDLRGLALTCLGHLARVYSEVSFDKVVPFLVEMKGCPGLEGRAQDALDDIDIFAAKG